MDTDTPLPHWLPDWKDLALYLKEAPYWIKPNEVHCFFAWQFLRRNPNYQQAYEDIRMEVDQVDIFLGNRRPGIRSDCVIGNYGYCQRNGITRYPRGKREASTDYKLQKMSELFLLAGFIPSPDWNEFIMPPPMIGGHVLHTGFYAWDDDTAPYYSLLKPHHRLFDIDLRRPLRKQFDDLKTELEGEIEEHEYHDPIIKMNKATPSSFVIEFLLKHCDPSLDWAPTTASPYRRLKLIDLYFPIIPQLEHHLTSLKCEQQAIPEAVKRLVPKDRNQDTLIRYLRILDALAYKAETIDIVKQLYPDKPRYEKAVGDTTKGKGSYSPAHATYYSERDEAQRLQQSGWRALLD